MQIADCYRSTPRKNRGRGDVAVYDNSEVTPLRVRLLRTHSRPHTFELKTRINADTLVGTTRTTLAHCGLDRLRELDRSFSYFLHFKSVQRLVHNFLVESLLFTQGTHREHIMHRLRELGAACWGVQQCSARTRTPVRLVSTRRNGASLSPTVHHLKGCRPYTTLEHALRQR